MKRHKFYVTIETNSTNVHDHDTLRDQLERVLENGTAREAISEGMGRSVSIRLTGSNWTQDPHLTEGTPPEMRDEAKRAADAAVLRDEQAHDYHTPPMPLTGMRSAVGALVAFLDGSDDHELIELVDDAKLALANLELMKLVTPEEPEPEKQVEAEAQRGLADGVAVWRCKVGGRKAEIPWGGDFPMRQAVKDAYLALTGEEPEYVSSGWGGTLTDTELGLGSGPSEAWVRAAADAEDAAGGNFSVGGLAADLGLLEQPEAPEVEPPIPVTMEAKLLAGRLQNYAVRLDLQGWTTTAQYCRAAAEVLENPKTGADGLTPEALAEIERVMGKIEDRLAEAEKPTVSEDDRKLIAQRLRDYAQRLQEQNSPTAADHCRDVAAMIEELPNENILTTEMHGILKNFLEEAVESLTLDEQYPAGQQIPPVQHDELRWPDAFGVYQCWWKNDWYNCYAYRRKNVEELEAPGIVMLINTGEYYASGAPKYRQGDSGAPRRFSRRTIIDPKTLT